MSNFVVGFPLVSVHPETTTCYLEPFNGIRACPDRVEGIDSAKDLTLCVILNQPQADEGSRRLEFLRPALIQRGTQDMLRRPPGVGTPQNDI